MTRMNGSRTRPSCSTTYVCACVFFVPKNLQFYGISFLRTRYQIVVIGSPKVSLLGVFPVISVYSCLWKIASCFFYRVSHHTVLVYRDRSSTPRAQCPSSGAARVWKNEPMPGAQIIRGREIGLGQERKRINEMRLLCTNLIFDLQ